MTNAQHIEKAAEEYATGNHRTSMPDTYDLKAFKAGARAQLEAPVVREMAEAGHEMDAALCAFDENEQGARMKLRHAIVLWRKALAAYEAAIKEGK